MALRGLGLRREGIVRKVEKTKEGTFIHVSRWVTKDILIIPKRFIVRRHGELREQEGRSTV